MTPHLKSKASVRLCSGVASELHQHTMSHSMSHQEVSANQEQYLAKQRTCRWQTRRLLLPSSAVRAYPGWPSLQIKVT